MLSKYAIRASTVGIRCLSNSTLASNTSNRTNLNVFDKKLCFVPITGGILMPKFQNQLRQMSGSIADEIINKAKDEEKKKSEMTSQTQGGGSSPEDPDKKDKGYKPMPKWQKWGYIVSVIMMGGLTIANAVLFSLPDRDENGNDVIDEYSNLPFPSQYYQRLKSKIFATKKSIEEPFSDRLLPDPLEEPYIQPKYTICVELTGLLVHSTWSHKYGWRFQKRPGVDILINQLGYPNFELVVYTIENGMTFMNIIDGLDPQNCNINYRLFRDGTRFVNGHPTKDVNSLNRDPKRVIFIDWNKDSVALATNNSLILPKWEGDNSDTSLIGLASLLHAIKESDIDDVRDVLSYYKQHDDPIAVFRENQRKLQEETQAYEERQKEEAQKKALNPISGFGGLSGFSFMRRR